MKALIEQFPDQLREAVEIFSKSSLRKSDKPLKNVLITGLGGSGIGGTIAAEICAKETPLPIVVSKGYFIPGWVNQDTLVIVSSYSGNTEETINAMKLAMERKAWIVAITSGGWIAETAKKENYDLILLPGGNPPRACLGYSLTQVLGVLHFHGCMKDAPAPQLLAASILITDKKSELIKEAERLTAFFKGKIPVIYSTTYREGVSIRFRQQINENAKMLCWHHVVPEMNHNELVGWREKNENLAVLFFRDRSDYERNQKRMEINKEVIKACTPHITETWSEGDTAISNVIWHIHLGDWVSWFLSVENHHDATEVKVIDKLKNELSKF